jgi:hypothetical protein
MTTVPATLVSLLNRAESAPWNPHTTAIELQDSDPTPNGLGEVEAETAPLHPSARTRTEVPSRSGARLTEDLQGSQLDSPRWLRNIELAIAKAA